MIPMNDKIEKAKELLEGIKSVLQSVSGEVTVEVSRDEWDKVIQAKSLLRSLAAETQEECDSCTHIAIKPGHSYGDCLKGHGVRKRHDNCNKDYKAKSDDPQAPTPLPEPAAKQSDFPEMLKERCSICGEIVVGIHICPKGHTPGAVCEDCGEKLDGIHICKAIVPTASPEPLCETCGGLEVVCADCGAAITTDVRCRSCKCPRLIPCTACQPVEPKNCATCAKGPRTTQGCRNCFSYNEWEPKAEKSCSNCNQYYIDCDGQPALEPCERWKPTRGVIRTDPKAGAQQPWTIYHVKNYPDMALARIHDLEAQLKDLSPPYWKQGRSMTVAEYIDGLEVQLTEAKQDAETFEDALKQKKAALSGCMRENRELKAKLVEAKKGI